MANPPSNTFPEPNRKTFRGLLFWLGLLPIILGSLILCGQIALLVSFKTTPTNTASRLIADYLPWTYDLIPALNIPGLLEDIQRDERALNTPSGPAAVVTGVFLEPPTPTVDNTQPVFPTPTNPPAETATKPAQATSTPQPSRTLTPTLAPTNTLAPTFLPTWTPSEEPQPEEPTATNPPVPTATFTATSKPPDTPVPSATFTTAPTATFTRAAPTATFTRAAPKTPAPTNTPDPKLLHPTVGTSVPDPESGGCRVSFGYENNNASEIFVPYSPLGPNQLNPAEEFLVSVTARPEHFQPGIVAPTGNFPSFTVVWTQGGPVSWILGGYHADAVWCH